MKTIALLAFFTVGPVAFGQNLIGYKDVDIRKFMKENKMDMSFNKVTNTKFMYLKYSDFSDSQTLLFFLNPDSVCQSIRIICDSIAKAKRINEFNTLYKKGGQNIWIDRRNGKDYIIEIRDEKWSSIITIEQNK